MAVTIAPGDVIIDNELVRLGIVETLEQNINGFNAASNGTITLGSKRLENDFTEESFIKGMAALDLVKRRDYTSTADVTPQKLIEDAVNTVKLSRIYGPMATTYDAWNRSGRSVETASLAFGKQLGVAIQADMLNTLLIAGTAAIDKTNGTVGDGTQVFDYTNIVDGLVTFGDQMGNIQMLVMHSNTYGSMIDKGLSMNALDTVGGATIREGGAYSLGLPVLVTDSPSLYDGTGAYKMLGLTTGALNAIESDETIMKTQDVLLKENIQKIIQGEGSYNVGIKGCKFDDSKSNPEDTDLGNKDNWTYMFSDVKASAGFQILVKARG